MRIITLPSPDPTKPPRTIQVPESIEDLRTIMD